MPERVRNEGSRGSWERAPSPEDVRRQLEGGLEVVEAARERYASLESLLSGRKWRRRLREQPDAIPSLLRQEPALDEALARIHRRAGMDQWPEELPVLAAVRDLRALRGRLEALVLKRLDELAPVSGTPSLVEALTRLEGLVLQRVSLELAPGEVRLLEGDTTNVWGTWLVLQCAAALLLGLFLGGRMGVPGLIPLPLLGVLAANLVFSGVLKGSYRVTSERLVWKPHKGEPAQLLLRSIPDGGIRSFLFGVRVVGERELYIPHENHPHLAVLLELRRQPPLLGHHNTEPLADVVCYRATLQGGLGYNQGFVVLRPGYAAFIPLYMGTEVVRAITGVRPSFSASIVAIPVIIEQLRYLPSEAAFDACVERAVAAAGGLRWSAWETRYDSGAPVWKEIRLWSGEGPRLSSLSGKVDWNQQTTAVRILADWPKR